ncbi:MAG TPA: 5-oxoprolinase subunit PxpA [Candidatus Nanopelagicales bacterium]|nr:5-oxoprolinase subunit PxpA [Candidatus Nanopelagicales bacterium]
MAARIDLNADVGESLGPWPMGADAALIPLVTSVNVACGFHAGDPLTMRRTVRMALDAGVAVGAHPGYPDLVGFGRRAMDLTVDELEAAVIYQVAALAGIVGGEGGRLTHVKPHGALYHRLAADSVAARAFAAAVARLDPRLRLVAPPGAALLAVGADVGLRCLVEGFADRVYEADGRLRSRGVPGALHEDPDVAAAQAVSIARDGRVTSGDGSPLALRADTICIHGDTPGAVAIAAAVRRGLADAGIEVRAADG